MLSLYETLQKVEQEKNESKKIELLKIAPAAIQMFFQYALDPRVVWILPEGDPPYRENEFLDQEAIFWQNIRKLEIFCKGGSGERLPSIKREQIFIQILETIDKNDAKLLMNAKNKTLPFSSITVPLIKKAFPDLNIIEMPQTEQKQKRIFNKGLSGFIWINDGTTNKTIPQNDEIPVGWTRGMIRKEKTDPLSKEKKDVKT